MGVEMTRLVFVLALFVAAPLSAQTHFCDQTQPLTQTVGAGQLILQFCHDEKDVDGAPLTNPRFTAIIDGVRTPLTVTRGTATANAAGLWHNVSQPIGFVKGSHVLDLEIAADDGFGGTQVATLPFTVTVRVKGSAPKSFPNQKVKIG